MPCLKNNLLPSAFKASLTPSLPISQPPSSPLSLIHPSASSPLLAAITSRHPTSHQRQSITTTKLPSLTRQIHRYNLLAPSNVPVHPAMPRSMSIQFLRFRYVCIPRKVGMLGDRSADTLQLRRQTYQARRLRPAVRLCAVQASR